MHSFPSHNHNHQHCIDEAMALAAEHCRSNRVKLTNTRRDVLAIIWKNHQPLGAYAILDALAEARGGTRVAPPTVYRALDFLLEQGLIHRLNSLNAYIGCSDPLTDHRSLFLICRKCHNVAELHQPQWQQLLGELTASEGFRLERATVEISGLCPNCHIRVSP